MNKYLEKIAEDNHVIKGMLSPAWQRASIAKDHGKETGDSLGKAYAVHMGGMARGSLRGAVEGGVGAVVGEGVEVAMKTRPRPRLAALGTLLGATHGIVASIRNQGREAHKEFK